MLLMELSQKTSSSYRYLELAAFCIIGGGQLFRENAGIRWALLCHFGKPSLARIG